MGLEEIRHGAEMAELKCEACGHVIDFDTFLDEYPHRINEDEEIIDFGCVECDHDTVELRSKGRRDPPSPTMVVHGIEELERMVGR